MDFKDVIGEVQASKEYTTWLQEEPDAYLAHVFCEIQKNTCSGWQVGYGHDTRVTSFGLVDGKVVRNPASEVLQKETHAVDKLPLGDIKIGVLDAFSVATDWRDKEHPAEIGQHIIAVLQVIDGKAVWNFTLATITFRVLNIRVDVASGEVVKGEVLQLFDWQKGSEKNS